MVEKISDVEAKANLQPPFYIRKIDSRYPKGHRPLTKKEDTYWEPRNEASKNKNKAKSQTSSSANQPQTQALKKDKRGRWGGHRGYPTTGVNATKVVKKDKDKAPKDMSNVKCYTYHQKGHYANSCLNQALFIEFIIIILWLLFCIIIIIIIIIKTYLFGMRVLYNLTKIWSNHFEPIFLFLKIFFLKVIW